MLFKTYKISRKNLSAHEVNGIFAIQLESHRTNTVFRDFKF